MNRYITLLLSALVYTSTINGQVVQDSDESHYVIVDSILINNGSFESIPEDHNTKLYPWVDCGLIFFPRESPPDSHSSRSKQFNVKHDAIHDDRFLSMVTRDNGTWESISQELDKPLRAERKYLWKMYLATSRDLQSISALLRDRIRQKPNQVGFPLEEMKFDSPTRIFILGGSEPCQEEEILYHSPVIDHQEWKMYKIKLEPKTDISSIKLGVIYGNLTRETNGNILFDGISNIYEIEENDPALDDN